MNRGLHPSKPTVVKSKQKTIINALRESGGKGLTRLELMKLTQLDRQAIDRSVVLINLQGGKITKEDAPAGSDSRQVLVLRKEPAWYCSISLHARLALHIAEAALPQIGSESLAQFLELFGKLEESKLSPKDQHRLETLLHMVQVKGAVQTGGAESPSFLLPILESLCTHPGPTEVQIEYQSGSRLSPKQRIIIPYALTYDSFAGSSYLLAQAATSHGRQPLLFRVSRITKWEPTRKTGFLTPEERQHLERAKKYQLGGWIEDAEPFEIQVKITGKKWISAFLERPPGLPEFQIEEVKAKGGSHQIIRFKATEMSGPARWVLQLGPEAEVLSPPEFRTHVADRLHEAAEIYRTRTKA
jgi:hypothetical protein